MFKNMKFLRNHNISDINNIMIIIYYLLIVLDIFKYNLIYRCNCNRLIFNNKKSFFIRVFKFLKFLKFLKF